VQVSDAHTLLANFKVTPTYYLYRDKVKINIKSGAAKIRNIKLPQGDLKNDPNFGEMMVFHHSFQAEVGLINTNTTAQNITLEATYQGCSENGASVHDAILLVLLSWTLRKEISTVAFSRA